jgi:N-dimethylarginine dimethylaminohydrolase
MVGKLTPDKKNSEICQAAVKDVGKPVGRAKMLRMIGAQLEGLVTALQAHGVTVLRPDEIALARVTACNAIFARDGLLVIGQDVLNSNLHLPHRRDEHIAYMESIRTYFAGIGAVGGARKSISNYLKKHIKKSKLKTRKLTTRKLKTRKLYNKIYV